MNGSVQEFLELGPKSVLDRYELSSKYDDPWVYCVQDECEWEIPQPGTLRELLTHIEAHEKTHVLRHYEGLTPTYTALEDCPDDAAP